MSSAIVNLARGKKPKQTMTSIIQFSSHKNHIQGREPVTDLIYTGTKP